MQTTYVILYSSVRTPLDIPDSTVAELMHNAFRLGSMVLRYNIIAVRSPAVSFAGLGRVSRIEPR